MTPNYRKTIKLEGMTNILEEEKHARDILDAQDQFQEMADVWGDK